MTGIKLPTPELLPECTVFRALAVSGLGEHRMVLPLDLLERIAERLEKILVGTENGAIERELDHGLRLADR